MANKHAWRKVHRRYLRGSGIVIALSTAVMGLMPLQAAHAATITVNTTADETATDGNCSLEEAVQAANTQAPVDACPAGTGNDTIVLAAGATYALTTVIGPGADGLPTITGSMTIEGNGATITRASGAPAFSMTAVDTGASLSLHNVTVTGFEAPASAGSPGTGGAIFSLGALAITDSTISNNRADGPGGGVDARGGAIVDAGTLTMTNSTVSGNTAVGTGGSVGGGIIIRPGSTTVLTSDTFAGNSANNGADIETEASALTITDTIMGTGCLLEGPVTDGGHNLDAGSSCGFNASSDLRNTNPQLGPLANNGGPTPTLALAPGSPAIDAGGTCPAADGGTDQRGLPRFTPCDIGAYEVQDQAPALTVTPGTPSEAVPFTGAVAAVTDNDAPAGGDLTASIDWGDGSPHTGGTLVPVSGQPGHFTVNGTHTYADEGTFPLSVTITDSDSGPVSATAAITVADAPLTASRAPALTGTEGPTSLLGPTDTAPVSGAVATFTDANPATSLSDFTATIAWGDGTTSAAAISGPSGGTFSVSGSHSYQEDGTYTITVTIHDDGGATASATSSAVIADPPLPFLTIDILEDLLGG
jgi:CSLREA domain-containing protein